MGVVETHRKNFIIVETENARDVLGNLEPPKLGPVRSEPDTFGCIRCMMRPLHEHPQGRSWVTQTT